MSNQDSEDELNEILEVAKINWQTSPDEIFDKGVIANAKNQLLDWHNKQMAEAKAQVAQAVEDTTAMAQDGTIWIDYKELHSRVTLESLRTKSPKGETNGKTN